MYIYYGLQYKYSIEISLLYLLFTRFLEKNKQKQHRDLKMANSLFEDSSPVPIVKVIDFGLCAEFKDGRTSRAFVGTILYTAPEVGQPLAVEKIAHFVCRTSNTTRHRLRAILV